MSYGNRVIICQTTFLLWVPSFLSYKLWKQKIELSKKAIQTTPQSLAQGRPQAQAYQANAQSLLLEKDPKFRENIFFFFIKIFGRYKKNLVYIFFFTIKNAKKLSNIRYKGKTNLNKQVLQIDVLLITSNSNRKLLKIL